MKNVLRGQFLLCLACLLAAPVPAAEPTETTTAKSDLRVAILRADEALFDAFNRSDLEGIAKIFAPDL